jgi:hypothetical protein
MDVCHNRQLVEYILYKTYYLKVENMRPDPTRFWTLLANMDYELDNCFHLYCLINKRGM